MDAKQEKLSKNRTKFTVTISADERKKGEVAALEKISQSLKLKGFRPGKAPADMVRSQVTDDDLLSETVRALLPNILRTAIGDTNFKAVLPPKVNIAKADPLTVEILIIERPTVKLKKPDGIKLDAKPAITVTPAERDEFIGKILSQDRVETPVDRAVQKDDFVRLGLKTVDSDGKAIDELTVERYPMQVGADDLLPELSEHVVGMKPNEEKSTSITFPKDHDIPGVRGKKTTVTMTVKSVATVKNPELTPEFLKTRFGIEKQIPEFHADVEKMLMRNRETEQRRKREDQFFDEVREHTSIELPEELVDAEVEHMLTGLLKDLQERNTELDDWLKSVNKDRKQILEEMKDTASKRITLRYGLEELINYKKIEVNDGDIGAALMNAEAQTKAGGQQIDKSDYQPGGQRYEQLKWEKQIEKLMEACGV